MGKRRSEKKKVETKKHEKEARIQNLSRISPFSLIFLSLKKKKSEQRQNVCEGHGPSALSDYSSFSPTTNSARPAGCGIASLASQGQFTPGRASASAVDSQSNQVFRRGRP